MNVLFLPIFSMRSYETGKYAVLKDGNFQLTLARALASDFEKITIGIPEDLSDEVELINLIFNRLSSDRITLRKFKYGANTVETRKSFWDLNSAEFSHMEINSEYDLIITDITGYQLFSSGLIPFINNFNITKLPELNRPYIDEFFETDLQAIDCSLFTTVLNPRQREYILEIRPDLVDKVIAHTKCAHELLLPVSTLQLASNKTIFWPFRLSDKAYQWEQFKTAFEDQGLEALGYNVVITDPNESSKELPRYVSKMKPTKEEYYKILSCRPVIIMLDDIDTVLHPGTIEFFYYRCPVITFKANLIENTNSIESLSELTSVLANLDYSKVNTSKFVYNHFEIDELYNQKRLSVKCEEYFNVLLQI